MVSADVARLFWKKILGGQSSNNDLVITLT